VGVLNTQYGYYDCIQTVEERALTLLSLRIVDDVVFDVQNNIDADFCCALGIDIVFEVLNHIDFPPPRNTKIDLPITPDDEKQ